MDCLVGSVLPRFFPLDTSNKTIHRSHFCHSCGSVLFDESDHLPLTSCLLFDGDIYFNLEGSILPLKFYWILVYGLLVFSESHI